MEDFSEGQKKKVLIARSLCEKAHLLVWDEPLNFVDILSQEQIELLLQKGYDGYFSLEWVKRWDLTLEEPGIVFAHYVNYMRKLEQ